MSTPSNPNPNPSYPIGHAPSQIRHHALRTASNSALHLLPHLTRAAQNNPSLHLLDIGAGPGTLSASLAQHIQPQGGHVLATDISDEVLSQAREHAAAQGVENISFLKAGVYDLPFGRDGDKDHGGQLFDVVHAHQVLVHLPDPVAAIKEMVRVAKPGTGLVSLREADMEMWCFWPEGRKGLERFREVMVAVLVANGGWETGGRRLVSWCLEAGVPRERIEAGFGTWCFGSREEREGWGEAMIERLKAGELRKKGLELGITTEEEIDEMIQAWKEWIETEDATLGMMHGEVIIHKP